MKGNLSIDQWQTDWKEARQRARRFADTVRAGLGSRVDRIRLYGSAFRGDWTPESDIDVLILLDHVDTPDTEWIVKQATRMGILQDGLLIQPLVMSGADFDRMKNLERRFAVEMEQWGEDL